MLDKPAHGRLLFEQIIRENLDLGRPDQVQLIFDRRIIRTTPGRFRTRVLTRGVTPSLHVDYKRTRIKQYHKEGRALRTETTINNTYDFGIGKRLANLPKLREVGFAANRRACSASSVSPTACSPKPPSRRSNDRSAAVSASPACASPIQRSMTSGTPCCSSACSPTASATPTCASTSPTSKAAPQSIGRGSITYQLRRLRLHGMIERLPNSHRYRVTDIGWRTALFYTRTYNRLLRPGLAAVLPGHAAQAAPPAEPSTPSTDVFSNRSLKTFSPPKLDAFSCSFDTQAELAARNVIPRTGKDKGYLPCAAEGEFSPSLKEFRSVTVGFLPCILHELSGIF